MLPDNLLEKFWSRVNKTDTCWEWTAGLDTWGYGQFKSNGLIPSKVAHRVSFYLHNGYLPERPIQICHTCDNPRCVRPDHLFEGTPLDNMRDKAAKNRARYLRGEEHPNIKLNWEDVSKIKQLYSEGEFSMRELGETFHVSTTMICKIINNQRWKVAA